jgi:hypothetical protein
MVGRASNILVIPRWSGACRGMRGTHAHRMDRVFMGGPNKSGHDEEKKRQRGG